MEIITLSGKIHGDCESRKDKNGNTYIRFKVVCTSKDFAGKDKYTAYRCYCYDTSFNDLKTGDIVFLSGDQKIDYRSDNTSKQWINIDVYVKNITRGN